eukprot:m51a1_g7019 hypothetical protein (295) ;mRNA; f:39506-40522
MSSRTDMVFAAFQGPVLSVGASVVYMYRAYTVELLLPRHWRLANGLATDDVLAALRCPVVRASASASYPALTCASCGDVVSVTEAWSPSERLPGDLECYRALLRSSCTSSRRHLRCDAVVLGVTVGGVDVFSEPFAVFAREPGRQSKRRQRRPRLPWPAQQHEVSSSVNVAISAAAAASASAALVLGAVPRAQDPRLFVLVEIWRPPRNLEDIPPCAAALIPGSAEVLRQVPGFVLQKSSVSHEMAVFVRAYRTAEDAALGADIGVKYIRNIIPNAVNRDVEGMSVLLARFSNW